MDEKLNKEKKQFQELKTSVEVKQTLVDMKIEQMSELKDKLLNLDKNFNEGALKGASKAAIDSLTNEVEQLKKGITDTQSLWYKHSKDYELKNSESGQKLVDFESKLAELSSKMN